MDACQKLVCCLGRMRSKPRQSIPHSATTAANPCKAAYTWKIFLFCNIRKMHQDIGPRLNLEHVRLQPVDAIGAMWEGIVMCASVILPDIS